MRPRSRKNALPTLEKADSSSTSHVASSAAFVPAFGGIVDAVLEVGRQRKLLLQELRFELESGDDKAALKIARQLCGIEESHEEGHRTRTRIN